MQVLLKRMILQFPFEHSIVSSDRAVLQGGVQLVCWHQCSSCGVVGRGEFGGVERA